MVFIKRHLYLLFLIFPLSLCFSQIAVPFTVRYQSIVKGDMTVIANNITNRIDTNTPNIAYVNRVNTPKNNEEFQMGYIDIDSDESTFSSSSAELSLENTTNKKIIYAGLYWSATYKYDSGYKKNSGKFVADNESRESFEKIKIKLPNQENYLDITGKIIFDGIKERKFKKSAPYAVYADITSEILKLSNPFGNYTVANVRATTGSIYGGVAAGWTLFFIYEDPQMKEKFITSSDGFSAVTRRATNIVFKGFETPNQGNVIVKIATAALEGDNNLIGDQLLFKTTKKSKELPLSNLLRKKDNFFNSTITIGNEYFLKRNPNSKNTLGYDTCLITMPNPDNTIIGNNTKEVTIKIKSSGDSCFLFFTAFNVCVSEPVNSINPIENQEPIVNTSVLNSKVIQNTEPIETKKSLITSNKIIESKKDTDTVLINHNSDTEKGTEINPIINNTTEDIFNYNIKGIKKGYYIIVNVFAKERNRVNFISFLKSKGFKAASFFNPIKKYHYVYIEESENKEEIQNVFNSKINNSYKEDMWILAVNNPNLQSNALAETKKRHERNTFETASTCNLGKGTNLNSIAKRDIKEDYKINHNGQHKTVTKTANFAVNESKLSTAKNINTIINNRLPFKLRLSFIKAEIAKTTSKTYLT